jgi:hypothetical protein
MDDLKCEALLEPSMISDNFFKVIHTLLEDQKPEHDKRQDQLHQKFYDARQRFIRETRLTPQWDEDSIIVPYTIAGLTATNPKVLESSGFKHCHHQRTSYHQVAR